MPRANYLAEGPENGSIVEAFLVVASKPYPQKSYAVRPTDERIRS